MIVYKAPQDYSAEYGKYFTIFLGGSIEMGKAEDWQDEICDRLEKYDVMMLNPRRDNWDITIEQSIKNPLFCKQVNWELDSIKKSDLVIMYLQPNTLSPISLLEIGIMSESGKLIVCCPDGFWRKGNIEIVCDRNNITLLETKEELFEYVERTILQTIEEIK